MVQLELISAILDGQDILCCTATGDGKLAAFSIPCLVLLVYNQHPESYPTNFPTCSRQIGHTNKGISQQYCMFTFFLHFLSLTTFLGNELQSKLNISAFSYCHETLSKVRNVGVHLAQEIMECIKWQVICVNPEHLHDKEWREITESLTF